jgi:hypothetical protein
MDLECALRSNREAVTAVNYHVLDSTIQPVSTRHRPAPLSPLRGYWLWNSHFSMGSAHGYLLTAASLLSLSFRTPS